MTEKLLDALRAFVAFNGCTQITITKSNNKAFIKKNIQP